MNKVYLVRDHFFPLLCFLSLFGEKKSLPPWLPPKGQIAMTTPQMADSVLMVVRLVGARSYDQVSGEGERRKKNTFSSCQYKKRHAYVHTHIAPYFPLLSPHVLRYLRILFRKPSLILRSGTLKATLLRSRSQKSSLSSSGITSMSPSLGTEGSESVTDTASFRFLRLG